MCRKHSGNDLSDHQYLNYYHTNGKTSCNRIRRNHRRGIVKRNVPRRTGKRARNHCPHFRQDAHALHQDSSRRQGQGGDVALRPLQRPHSLPLQISNKQNQSHSQSIFRNES